jgi:hypothetical protein
MRRTTVATAFLALAVAGCGSDDTGPVRPASDDASLHVVNTAAGAVDVTVDGQVVRRALAVGALSDRIGIAAGSRTVQLRLASAPANPQTVTLDARAGRSYLVSAMAAPSGSLGAELDTGATPIPGRSKLRILHLAPNAPPVDVWRTQPDFMTPIRVQFPFPYGSKSPFLESDPGTWEVWVTPEGSGPEERITSSGPVVLEGGWVRTLILLDINTNPGLTIVDDR